MNNLRFHIFSFLMFISITSFGFWDDYWEDNTPGKNKIVSLNDNEIYLVFGPNELKHLSEWFFYRGFVLGKFYSDKDKKDQYFILNENKKELKILRTEYEFEKFLKKENLNPTFRRVYDSNWSIFPKQFAFNVDVKLFFILRFAWPILAIPLFGLIFFLLKEYHLGNISNRLKTIKSRVLKWSLVILKITFLILIFQIFKGAFPQSF